MLESIIISTLAGSIICTALLIFKNKLLSLLGGKALYYISLIAMLVFILPMNIGDISLPKVPINQPIKVTEFEATVPETNNNVLPEQDTPQEAPKAVQHNVLPQASNMVRHSNPITMQEILLAVWLLGFIISMCRYFISYFRFKKKICGFEICENINGVEVIKSPLVASPLVFGFFKPTLAIPEIEMNEDDYNLAIKHEMVHYKHHDSWFKLFAVIVNSICWFNPITYFMVNLIGEACEYACDEQVTKEMDMTDKKQYSTMILSMVCQSSPALSSNMVKNKKQLKRRFEMIMKKKRFSVFRTVLCTVLILTLTCGSVVLANEVAPLVSSLLKDDYVYITNFETGEYNQFVPIERDGEYFLPLREFLNSSSIENDKIKYEDGRITIDVWSEEVKFGGSIHIGDDGEHVHNEPEKIYPAKHIWSAGCVVGSNTYQIANNKFELSKAPYLEDGIAYVPYEFIKAMQEYEESAEAKGGSFNDWTNKFVSVMLYKYDSFESKYSCDDVQGDRIPGYKDNFQNTFNAYAAISRTGYRTNFAMSYDFKDANDKNAKVGHVDVVLNEVTRIYSKGSDIEGLFTVKIDDKILYENEKGYISNLPIPAGEGTLFHSETHVKIGELRNRIFFKGFGNISEEYNERVIKNRELEKSPDIKIISLYPVEVKLNGLKVGRADKNCHLQYITDEEYGRISLRFDDYVGNEYDEINDYEIHQEEECSIKVIDKNTFAGHFYFYDGLARIDSFDAIISLLPDNKFEFRSNDGRYIVRGTTGEYTHTWERSEEEKNAPWPQVVMIDE